MREKIPMCMFVLLIVITIFTSGSIANNVGTNPQTRSNVVCTPFRINSNADFTSSGKCTGGDGSMQNPWIIENYEIDGHDFGYCIFIGNTTDYFIIRNCILKRAMEIFVDPILFPAAPMTVYNAQNGTISNNYIWGATRSGVHIYTSTNIIITNNIIEKNSMCGVFLYLSNENTITSNILSTNNDGILLRSSNSNTIEANNVSQNNANGISLIASYSNHISNNNISKQIYGIYLNTSFGNYIDDNVFIDNDYLYFDTLTNPWIPPNSSDIDQDNLTDQWEINYFGNLVQSGNDDFDNDGYTNTGVCAQIQYITIWKINIYQILKMEPKAP